MSTPEPPALLEKINSPADLRELEQGQLNELAEEIRSYLIESVSTTGGHLAPGLGAVELTVALHYVFNTPDDRLVWDIGHQAYPHKIITGRKEKLHTIRPAMVFPAFCAASKVSRRFRSRPLEHFDQCCTGHGRCVQTGTENRPVVAIIGDGGLTAGQAMEALNNAGDMDSDILVILNDKRCLSRRMSALSPTTWRGFFQAALTRLSVREAKRSSAPFHPCRPSPGAGRST
ncbi:MAG: hypothetical protein CM1200mP20_17100 [Pseudomonadota bacterium]|nr:MAG: hypothetical protein CM1200mP20_17100 [Pseudomonadota bacterium]